MCGGTPGAAENAQGHLGIFLNFEGNTVILDICGTLPELLMKVSAFDCITFLLMTSFLPIWSWLFGGCFVKKKLGGEKEMREVVCNLIPRFERCPTCAQIALESDCSYSRIKNISLFQFRCIVFLKATTKLLGRKY